jgi:hypothetical protein
MRLVIAVFFLRSRMHSIIAGVQSRRGTLGSCSRQYRRGRKSQADRMPPEKRSCGLIMSLGAFILSDSIAE